MTDPKGRILKTRHYADGTSHVVLDNGAASTITIRTFSEDLPSLLGSDLAAIRTHLMTRGPGHFRRKEGRKGS